MKLRFKTSPQAIREAGDAARGHRVKYIQGYYDVMAKAIQGNGYKCSLNSDITSGFKILPQFKHILAFKFYLDKENNLGIGVYTCKNDLTKDAADSTQIGSIATTEAMQELKNNLKPALAEYCKLYLISGDKLTENTKTLTEAKPFAALKNKIANAVDKRAANKQDANAQKAVYALLDEVCKKAGEDLKQIASKYTITVTGKDGERYISIQAPHIADIKLGAAPEDSSKVRVVAITGPDNVESSANISTLESLTKMLSKRLGLKGGIDAVYEYLKAEVPADDEDATDNSDDADDAVKSDSNYQLTAIAAGASKLSSKEIADLLESRSDPAVRSHTWLTESALKLQNNVNSDDYNKVYQDIKGNASAENALVKRFIHKAFNIPTSDIEAKVAQSSNFEHYALMLKNQKFKIDSLQSPSLFTLSMYLQKRKEFSDRYATAVRGFFAEGANTAEYQKQVDKNNECARIPSGKFASLDELFENRASIFYAEIKNSQPLDMFKCWYQFDTNYNINAIVKALPGNESLHKAFCELVGLDPDSIQNSVWSKSVVKLHVFSTNGTALRSAKDVINILEIMIKKLATMTDSGKANTLAADTVQSIEDQLAADSMETPVDDGDFYKFIIQKLKEKNLQGDALAQIQKAVFDAINGNG